MDWGSHFPTAAFTASSPLQGIRQMMAACKKDCNYPVSPIGREVPWVCRSSALISKHTRSQVLVVIAQLFFLAFLIAVHSFLRRDVSAQRLAGFSCFLGKDEKKPFISLHQLQQLWMPYGPGLIVAFCHDCSQKISKASASFWESWSLWYGSLTSHKWAMSG